MVGVNEDWPIYVPYRVNLASVGLNGEGLSGLRVLISVLGAIAGRHPSDAPVCPAPSGLGRTITRHRRCNALGEYATYR